MADRVIKYQELFENDGENGKNLFVLIKGKVYDVTKFKHPGGVEILKDDIGVDRIDEFETIHSPAAKEDMKKYFIGILENSDIKDSDDYKKTDGDRNRIKSNLNLNLVFMLLFAFIVAILGYWFILK